MAFTLIQAGSALQLMDSAGALSTLMLPTGIALDATKTPRFAIIGRYVVMVNSPSRPITIDPNGVVRPLCPLPPALAPVLSSAVGGSLSGTYLAKMTFLILDDFGNIIAESDYSPISNSQAVVAAYLRAASLEVSADAVSARRLYRTTTLGSTYFQWADADGNIITAVQDDLSDAALSSVAASPTLGSPPRLTLVSEWKSRLFGVGDDQIDNLRYTEAGQMYAWNSDNDLPIPRVGSDKFGIRGLAPRRDALGVGRRDILWQIVGTTQADFRPVKLTENVGFESHETIIVYRDVAYFLWKDGVYRWSDDGIKNVSDGKVRSWFTKDDTFNRARFQFAFAQIDPIRNKYRLYLAAAGSTVEDRWIEYDLNDGTWWGPHKWSLTSKPSCAILIPDDNDVLTAQVGSSTGYIRHESSVASDIDDDGSAVGIPVDADGKFHDGNTPDIEKVWGQLSLIQKKQTAGVLTITPKVGGLNATAQMPIQAKLTVDRQLLRRMGTGRFVQLNVTHNVAGEPIELYGYEVPYFESGRR